jgi:polar amino acid transport system substrate-binding protein
VTRWLRTPLVLALALALAATACGDDDDGEQAGGGGGAGGQLTEIGSRLPEPIARARTLKVGSDIAYAPVEFFKEGTQEAQGIDVDICNAIAATFGGGFTCTDRKSVV